jgi:hypothetical protein
MAEEYCSARFLAEGTTTDPEICKTQVPKMGDYPAIIL